MPQPPSGRTFRVSYRIRLSDADATGRLRLDAVARYLQDAAIDDVMVIFNASTVAVLWFGAVRIENGDMQIGALTAFMAYLIQILMSVMMATFMSMMIPRGDGLAGRIQEVLDTESTVHAPAAPVPIRPGRVRGWSCASAILVVFFYPSHLRSSGATAPVSRRWRARCSSPPFSSCRCCSWSARSCVSCSRGRERAGGGGRRRVRARGALVVVDPAPRAADRRHHARGRRRPISGGGSEGSPPSRPAICCATSGSCCSTWLS